MRYCYSSDSHSEYEMSGGSLSGLEYVGGIVKFSEFRKNLSTSKSKN